MVVTDPEYTNPDETPVQVCNGPGAELLRSHVATTPGSPVGLQAAVGQGGSLWHEQVSLSRVDIDPAWLGTSSQGGRPARRMSPRTGALQNARSVADPAPDGPADRDVYEVEHATNGELARRSGEAARSADDHVLVGEGGEPGARCALAALVRGR